MTPPTRIRLDEDCWLDLCEGWLPPEEATRVFARLRDEVPWKHEAIRIAGRAILQPRLTAWYGDPGASYTYSGLTVEPIAWTPLLAGLRDAVAREAGESFNSALLNFYRDGRDSMGLHADDEPELGVNPVIASLSVGERRRFQLRPRKGVNAEPIDLTLSNGSLLVMGGRAQHHWKHGVPKEKKILDGRINLTFRRVVGRIAPTLTRRPTHVNGQEFG